LPVNLVPFFLFEYFENPAHGKGIRTFWTVDWAIRPGWV
jgi:hypothetical protein